MKARLTPVALLSAVALLVVVPAAVAALTVTRAELSGGQLRVEGEGAVPNATITIDGVAMGTAGSDGRFRIERSGFSSSTCKITVADGTTTTQTTLSGCTPAGPSPPPPPPPPPPPSPTAASFQGLGQLPGGVQTYAFGVSGDGKVVVGMSVQATNALRAFRWTAATGLQDLGDLGGGSAEGHAANADGSIVVGRSWDNSPGLGYHGFRWTASAGMEALPTAEGRDVSADGSVVVGGAVWTQSGGLHAPLGPCCQSAEGVSPDGGTITGWTSTANGIRAFHWTAATGVRDLGTLGGSESAGEDASLNGAVVVGQARDKGEFWRAFRWTASTGMQDLGSLGGPMARAFAVSDNGSVIVGRALTTSSSASEAAFRWTTTKKMQNLKRELLDAGLTSVQNWTLTTASRASADGTVIVGFGLNPSRQWEAFRAVLPVA